MDEILAKQLKKQEEQISRLTKAVTYLSDEIDSCVKKHHEVREGFENYAKNNVERILNDPT